MADYQSAGVFTEEVPSGQTAILSVSTSTFATAGWTPRGPENKALLCTSLADYFRKFGTYWKNSDMPLAVTAFYKNAGQNLYAVRVVPADATLAEGSIPGRWLIKAISRGTWGNLVRLVLKGNDNSYNHATAAYSLFDVQVEEESVDGLGDYSVVETYEGVDLVDVDSPDYFPLVLNDEQNGSDEVRIEMGVSGGVPSAFLPTAVAGEALGTGNGSQTAFAATLASDPVALFTAKVKVNGVVVAQDNGRGKFTMVGNAFTAISGTLAYDTGAVALTFTPAVGNGLAITADYYQVGAKSIAYDLSGGTDGTAVTRAEVSDPVLQLDRKGIYALDLVDEILNIGLADFRGDATVAGDLISYCEGRQDCFAILDTRPGIDAQDAKNYKQVTLASLSSWYGIYHPGIKIADPLKNGKPKAISPVGHIAGVYARTDLNRNVGKAPAGTSDGALNFSLGLETPLDKGGRDLIYPANVNPLIDTPATGRCVWGARTGQVVGDFNLVQVRRLFIFLRKSTYNSTQDLVFEGIDDSLLALVGLRMSSFMTRLTGQGYFASRVPAQAFQVICDSSNNTPVTIAARKLITRIKVAPQTPAEFVVFEFERQLNALA